MIAAKLSAPAAIGPYRILGVVGEGGMAVVYRGERAGSPVPVAIKTVLVPHESHLGGIRREIQALLHLRHPGIVPVLDEGVEDGIPWYAMELLEGRTLENDLRAAWATPARVPSETASRRRESPTLDATEDTPEPSTGVSTVITRARASPASSPPPTNSEPYARGERRPIAGGDDLPRVLQILCELCETLAFLHGEGIVHRDLKPANIFLRDGIAPVLMDFGIARRFPTAVGREVLDLSLPLAGTVGYMAPEQIQGGVLDARADLYSVGCILYQVVTGRLPFEAGTDDAVLWNQLHTNPTPPGEIVDGVSPALGELILRLLEKSPRDRLGHAGDVAAALEAMGAPRRPDYHRRPARAYVYRPALAGREDAIAQLTTHVDRLIGGRGGCVLVRGESGIGKTHLVMEVARAASARNLEVIAGSCAPVVPTADQAAAGGDAALGSSPNDAPLHAFRPLLLVIADRCRESGPELARKLLGDRAKVLAVCEPALAYLPGFEGSPEPPELPARAARERILRAVADTLVAFSKKWPLLLVLDDFQWADELSIELITSLPVGYFDQCPALILGTYRLEQTQRRLEELSALPHLTKVDLGKLDLDSVAAMVGDMLAMSPPPEPLVRFLSRRSEGHPFFVAEYIREAVAEELLCRSATGQWQLASASQGEAAYDLLPLPASLRELCGHRLSNLSEGARGLLETASVLGRDVDWELLSSAAPMSPAAAMDASRELIVRHILEESEPGRLRFLHDKLREVAHDRIHAARRASLHGAAGRTIESRCAAAAGFPLVYAKLARHFTEAGDTGKAMEYLEKAGEHALRTSSCREAAGFFRELLALDEKNGGDPSDSGRLTRARWERRLVEAYFALGDLEPMLEHARRGLSWAGHPLPESRLGWALRLLREVPVQAARRIAPRVFAAPGSSGHADAIEASLILATIAKGYAFTDGPKALTVSLWSMNLAERAGGDAKLASAYAGVGALLGLCRMPRLARDYFALARDTAERTNDRAGLVFSLYAQGYWLQTRGGEWQAASALCSEALEEARRLGDRTDIGYGQMVFGMIDMLSGRLDEGKRHFEAVACGAAERADRHRLAGSLLGLACVLLRMGRTDEAEARLEQALAALEGADNIPYRIRCQGFLASIHALKGDLDEAITLADLASTAIVKAPVMAGLGAAYGAAAEVYLARLARALESRPDDRAEARRGLRRITSKLRTVSVICPIAWPTYHRIQGRRSWLEGARADARRSWERGLAAALQLELPYDQALAHIDLASAERPGTAARQRHLDLAESLSAERGFRSALASVDALRAERDD